MDLYAGGESPLHVDAPVSRWELARRRNRCSKAAKLLLGAGLVGTLALCLVGLSPAAVAIPLFLGTISLLLAAASAGLFARVASLELRAGGQRDDDDGWGRGGWDDPADFPGGGSPTVDWKRFEQDFRAYCARTGARRG